MCPRDALGEVMAGAPGGTRQCAMPVDTVGAWAATPMGTVWGTDPVPQGHPWVGSWPASPKTPWLGSSITPSLTMTLMMRSMVALSISAESGSMVA